MGKRQQQDVFFEILKKTILIFIRAFFMLHLFLIHGDAFAGPAGSISTSKTISSSRLKDVTTRYEAVKPDLSQYSFESDIAAHERKPIPANIKKAVALIYQAGGADSPSILKYLLKTKGGLDAFHGKLMWEVRNGWLTAAIKEISREQKISLGLLDSGTEGSVANDTDKTLRILKQMGKLSEDDIIRMIEKKLPRIIEKETGIKGIDLKALDIELFSGKNLYSSAFTAKAPAIYKREISQVLSELSKNKYAYLTDGAIKSQVILRAAEKEVQLKKGMMAVGSAFDHFEYDPETGQVIHSQPDDWIEILRLTKDFSPQDAWGAAIGNHLMLLDKLHKIQPDDSKPLSDAERIKLFDGIQDDIAKYLMRGVMDTQSIKESLAGKEFRRFDIGFFDTPEKRQTLISELTGLAQDHKAATEYRLILAAADDILKNKINRASGRPVKPDSEVYGPIVRYLKSRETGSQISDDQWLSQAKLAFAAKSEEMSMKIMAKQFPDAVTAWLDPPKELIARGEKRSSRFNNENIRILAMVQMAGAWQQLHKKSPGDGPSQWETLVRSCPDKFRVDLENLSRMMEWKVQKDIREIGFKEKMLNGPWQKTGHQTLKERLKMKADDMWQHAVRKAEQAEIGFQGIFNGFDLKAIGKQMKEQAGRVAFDQMTDILGKADSVMTVLASYQQTEGMPPEERKRMVLETIMNEIIGQIPVAGEIHGLYQTSQSGDRKQQIELATILWERIATNTFNYGAVAAPIVFYINFSTQFVKIVGHEIFHPLRKDYADIIFKGFLEPSEAGLLRAGRNIPEGFSPTAYPSIVSRIPAPFAILTGEVLQQMMDDDKIPANVLIALGKEAQESGDNFLVIADLSTDYEKKLADIKQTLHYMKPQIAGAAGQKFQEELVSGYGKVMEKWERQLLISNYVKSAIKTDPRLFFEVHRQNTYRYFKKQIQDQFGVLTGYLTDIETLYREYGDELARIRQNLWSVRGTSLEEVGRIRRELEDRQKGFESEQKNIIQQERNAAEKVFRHYVEDWLSAKGDFSDADENLALKFVWHDEETKKAVASRLADAYIGSRNPGLAAEASLGLVRQMDRLVEEKARENLSMDLSILFEKSLPGLPEIMPFIDALAPEVDQKPEISFRTVTIEDGKDRVLQIEVSVSAVRENPGDEWVIKGVPGLKKVPVSAVPREDRETLGIKDGDESAYEISIEVENTRDQSLVAGGRMFLKAEPPEKTEPEPSPKPAAESGEKDQYWNLKKIILVHKPDGFPNMNDQYAYVKTQRRLLVTADSNGVHIKGLIDGKYSVKDCPDHSDRNIWVPVYVHRDIHIGLFPPSIKDDRTFEYYNPFWTVPGAKPIVWVYETYDSKSAPDYNNRCEKKTEGSSAGSVVYNVVQKLPVVVTPGVLIPVKLPPGYLQETASTNVRAHDEVHLPYSRDKADESSIPGRFGVSGAKVEYSSILSFDFGPLLVEAYEKSKYFNKKNPAKITARFIVTADLAYEIKDKEIIFDVVYELGGTQNESSGPLLDGFDKGSGPLEPVVQTWGDAQEQSQSGGQSNSQSGTGGAKPQTWQDLQPGTGSGTDSGQPSTWQESQAQTGGAVKPVSPDALPAPWDDTRIRQYIDDWMQQAIPLIAVEREGNWGYSPWGQVTGPGITIVGPPDHPQGWSRYRSLWAVKEKYDSINLCRLDEYISRRLNGQGLDNCKGRYPAAARVKPGEKPFNPEILQFITEIPKDEWIHQVPELIHKPLFIYFSNDVMQIMRCGRQANIKHISFIGMTQISRTAVLKNFNLPDPDIPVAAGPKAYLSACRLAEYISKKYQKDIRFLSGILLDEDGGLVKTGSCEALLGLEPEQKRKKR